MELGARLRAFAGFVRRGSFSGAGEELRISQPYVSKHIADMVRDFGVKIIGKRSTGFRGKKAPRPVASPTMPWPISVSCRDAGSPCPHGKQSSWRYGAVTA